MRDSKYGVPDSLRRTDEIKQVFGNQFVGPDLLPIGEKVMIATIEPEPGTRFKKVNVYCTAYPAKLFEVEGQARYDNLKDSLVEMDNSGELEEACEMAWSLAEERLDS